MVRVPIAISIHWRFLHQDKGLTSTEIMAMKKYKQYSKATICRHMKKATDDETEDKRKYNKGRPPKLDSRDYRAILREAEKLRKSQGHFTVKRVKAALGINEKVCDESIRRVFRKAGMRYTHSRKKGILKRTDLPKRLKFARTCKKLNQEQLWKTGISFYFDGVGFAHKYNPFDQARAPKSMAWRRPQDGLSFSRTARGSHEGTGGRVVHFMCAMAYDKGMILAEQYLGRINGEKFAEIVRRIFPDLFRRSANPLGRLFLQDGDPSQNSAQAKRAFDDVNARMFSIPPRSPDLNPIENVFNCIKADLKQQALDNEITNENLESFTERCRQTLLDYPIENINNTILSMPKRIDLVIELKGQRTKY
jgi:transposase